MSEQTLMKPLIMGAVVIALDKFALKNENMNESMYLGLAGAIGVYTGTFVAKMLPIPNLPTGEYFDGKTIELRVAEISVSAGVGYGINKFVLNNEYSQTQLLNKLALLAASDFISEYAVDYLTGKKLSYFTN